MAGGGLAAAVPAATGVLSLPLAAVGSGDRSNTSTCGAKAASGATNDFVIEPIWNRCPVLTGSRASRFDQP